MTETGGADCLLMAGEGCVGSGLGLGSDEGEEGFELGVVKGGPPPGDWETFVHLPEPPGTPLPFFPGAGVPRTEKKN